MKKTISFLLTVFLLLTFSSVISALPNDTYAEKQWDMPAVGFDWDLFSEKGLNGDGVTIAVIDSGLYLRHSELSSVKVSPKSKNFLGDRNIPGVSGLFYRDQLGHGTAIASLLVAESDNGKGISSYVPKATIMALRCFSSSDSAEYPYDERYDSRSGYIGVLCEAIDYAVENGADVINMSFGFTGCSLSLQNTINNAVKSGVLFIAAGGNDIVNHDIYPASYENVISVGGIKFLDDGSYSYLGTFDSPSSLAVCAPGNMIIDVYIYPESCSAGGKNYIFKSEYFSYSYVSGTSFSCAVVSALAALAKQVRPDINQKSFLSYLKYTSADLGEPGWDCNYGYGLVNFSSLVSELHSNPFYDVLPEDYYYESVKWGNNNEITNGTGENEFLPGKICTRAEIVTFLYRYAGQPGYSSKSDFKDVPLGKWYSDAVSWAEENGIVKGTDSSHFEPEKSCTRAEIVTFLYRMKGEKILSGYNNKFRDIRNGSWYYDAVIWALDKGITKGTSETSFSPDNKCTRAQSITLLYRFDTDN